jgi:hypothetical protein
MAERNGDHGIDAAHRDDHAGMGETLVDVARCPWRQTPESVPRVFQELHLSQIRAQRVSSRRDCGNRGVVSLFGGLPRILSHASKRLPLLSH